MRILQCHNYYTLRAGECAAVDMHVRVLREAGHEVTLFAYDNAEAAAPGAIARLRAGLRAVHSRQTGRDLAPLLARGRFDVAHVHNTWLRMSPSVFGSLSRRGVPVVATIHNYRWLCPAATLYRDGRLCHDCVEKPAGVLHAIAHRCYRGSALASGAVALATVLHRDVLRVFQRHIDTIVVQNDFVRRLLARYGFPEERMTVIGNACEAGPPQEASASGDAVLYAGRLEECKGVRTLMAAVELGTFQLRILGDGPLRSWLERTIGELRCAASGRVVFRGFVARSEVLREIAACAAVVLPSEWYESSPGIVAEAMAYGKPVISSDLGALREIVRDGENGLLFPAGDPAALAAAIARIQTDGELRCRLSAGALASYRAEMTPARHLERLLAAYELAVTHRSVRRRASGATPR